MFTIHWTLQISPALRASPLVKEEKENNYSAIELRSGAVSLFCSPA